jgi:hypothetical protein
MPGISLAETISQLSVSGEWGPETVSSTTLDGVPYAPYSKGDKLGRMADWTQEGKDREGRGGRQFNRNYRGVCVAMHRVPFYAEANLDPQTNKSTEQAHPHSLLFKSQKTNRPSLSLTTRVSRLRPAHLAVAAARYSVVGVNEEQLNAVAEVPSSG